MAAVDEKSNITFLTNPCEARNPVVECIPYLLFSSNSFSETLQISWEKIVQTVCNPTLQMIKYNTKKDLSRICQECCYCISHQWRQYLLGLDSAKASFFGGTLYLFDKFIVVNLEPCRSNVPDLPTWPIFMTYLHDLPTWPTTFL